MILHSYTVGPLAANCYVAGDEESREVLVIDPGAAVPELLEKFRESDLKVTAVLATHHHPDHTGGIGEMLEALPDAAFYMHRLDYEQMAGSGGGGMRWFGQSSKPPREPDRYLDHGDTVQVGAHAFTALHCPGHTPGSLCYAGEGVVFTGDVLFARSIGRSDFPGGDARALLTAIRDHLMALPDETAVLPGHNERSTIGEERRLNPYVVNPGATLGIDLD